MVGVIQRRRINLRREILGRIEVCFGCGGKMDWGRSGFGVRV